MKINSYQPSLLVAVLMILIPASISAITYTINTCMDSRPDNSLSYAPSLFGIKDTIDQNNVTFKDRKSQSKANRKVRHENHRVSKEESKKTKKDDLGVVLAIATIIPLVLFAIVGYHICKDLD